MPLATPKSRPVARSYNSTPGRRQQRFDPRRQSVKGSHGAGSKTDARRQNTLTQMDFVRLNTCFAPEDDDLAYLEYEPDVKQESHFGSGVEKAANHVLERASGEAPNDRKRRRTATNQGSKRIKEEVKVEESPLKFAPGLSKRARDEVGLQSSEGSSLSQALGGLKEPLKGNQSGSEERTPMRLKSVNLQITHSPRQLVAAVKQKKDTMLDIPMQPYKDSDWSRETAKIKPGSQVSQAPDPVEISRMPLSRAPAQPENSPYLSLVDRIAHTTHDLSRFSDPGMSIPDSEDEDETQGSITSSPRHLPTSRLACQKSFSQATTVDGSQPISKQLMTQPTISPSKPLIPRFDTSATSEPTPNPKFLPPPSSLDSETSIASPHKAYPVTESQLLPSSVMNFELPRLPGWSQNSNEAEN